MAKNPTIENLVPLNKRTKEEQRAIQRKAGIASGKARRRQKTLKELGDMIGGLQIKSEKTKAILRDAGISDEDLINDTVSMYSLSAKAAKGDPRAIEVWAKLRGQFKELSQTEVITPKPLVDLTERKKNGE